MKAFTVKSKALDFRFAMESGLSTPECASRWLLRGWQLCVRIVWLDFALAVSA